MSTHHTDDHTSAQDAFEALYDRCLQEILQRLEATTLVTADTIQAVSQALRDSLAKAGEVDQRDVQRVIETLSQHWQQVLAHGDQLKQDLQTQEAVQELTERGVSLLAHLAGAVKTVAGEVESRLQRELEYHTGTVVGAGNFFCLQCDKEIRKAKTGPLPPCSRCRGTIFRRRW
jgi:predicted RNase H-like nuclease (RuvC/YqgF family)